MNSNKLYLPGLNGLRAIAALSVVISHTMMVLVDIKLIPPISLPMSQYAVTLFFVISGFLITYLLLEEKKIGSINIKSFYIRRVLRIWPLYYLYIFVSFLFIPFSSFFDHLLSFRLTWYVFFAANFPFVFHQGIKALIHYWSIGVEEQFYLFWPLIMQLKYKRIVPVILFIFVILLTIKLSAYFLLGKESVTYQICSVIRFPAMMIGAIGSILYHKRDYYFMALLTSKITQFFSWIMLIVVGFELVHVPSVLVHELFSFISLSIIIGQVTVKNRLLNLEKKWCNTLGRISYGVYIIHPLLIIVISDLVNELPLNSFVKCSIIGVLVLTSTIALAHLSYTFVEKPFLTLKNKFSVLNRSPKELSLVS